ncbi:MAG: hypothetical protein IJ213_04120 [Bacteroidales bacterium]|nr:hypothetical protein [Bacteroidales bacterium]
MSIIQFSINLKIGKLKEYKVFRLTMSSLDHIQHEECPQCKGKWELRLYVNRLTRKPFHPEIVGKCERKDKCEYHLSPYDYLRNHPDELEEVFNHLCEHKQQYLAVLKRELPKYYEDNKHLFNEVTTSDNVSTTKQSSNSIEQNNNFVKQSSTLVEQSSANNSTSAPTISYFSSASNGSAYYFTDEDMQALENAQVFSYDCTQNTLFKALCRMSIYNKSKKTYQPIDKEKLKTVFEKYKVGTNYHQYTTQDGTVYHNYNPVFLQIDEKDRIHYGKIIPYQLNGKRLHSKKGYDVYTLHYSKPFIALHSDNGKRPNVCLQQCFFGQHLLKNTDSKTVVNIAEGDKTPLVMEYVTTYLNKDENQIWLSTGGFDFLNSQKLYDLVVDNNLSKVKLWADKGYLYDSVDEKGKKTTGWKTIADYTNKKLSKDIIEVDTFVEKRKDLGKNDDIADLYLKNLR